MEPPCGEIRGMPRKTRIAPQGGLRLTASHSVNPTAVAAFAGMIAAPSKGKPRHLADFDVASQTAKAEA